MLKILATLTFLSGCSYVPIHSVEVSQELKQNPVREIYVFHPAFPDKLPKSKGSIDRPDSYREMLPENQRISAVHLLKCLYTRFFGAKITAKAISGLESENLELKTWADGINQKLTKGITPLTIKPVNLNAEAALLIGVVRYGYVDSQLMWQFLFFKPRRAGKPNWTHVCHLNAMLIRPRDGKILMAVEHKDEISSGERNPQLLYEITKKTINVIVEAIPKP